MTTTLPIQPGQPVPAPRPLDRVDGGRLEVPPPASLLVFVKHDCPTCRLAMPYVDRLRRRMEAAGSGTSVVAVAQDPPDVAARFAHELGLGTTVVSEPEPYPLATAFAVRTVPTLFLVGADGKVEKTLEGFDKEGLEDLLRRTAAGDEPLFAESDRVPDFRPG